MRENGDVNLEKPDEALAYFRAGFTCSAAVFSTFFERIGS